MSYPAPRYHGLAGEATASLRRRDHPPELVNTSGGSVHYLATGASTGGGFGLYRWDFGPGVSGPGPHFHRTISESFFVLSGTVRLYDGTQWADGAPGDFMTVPVGGVHGFRNESGGPASMLLLFVPGAPREEYFETLVELAKGTVVLDERERAEFYLRHDNHWV
jgi:mannose-6-phosphate isomerase-like protein (cupin superfamily)